MDTLFGRVHTDLEFIFNFFIFVLCLIFDSITTYETVFSKSIIKFNSGCKRMIKFNSGSKRC